MNPISAADVQKATAEITTKSTEQIEEATAITWGARALACWALAQQAYGGADYWYWFKEATSYKHEAVEHAGWGPPGLVDAIRLQLRDVP